MHKANTFFSTLAALFSLASFIMICLLFNFLSDSAKRNPVVLTPPPVVEHSPEITATPSATLEPESTVAPLRTLRPAKTASPSSVEN